MNGERRILSVSCGLSNLIRAALGQRGLECTEVNNYFRAYAKLKEYRKDGSQKYSGLILGDLNVESRRESGSRSIKNGLNLLVRAKNRGIPRIAFLNGEADEFIEKAKQLADRIVYKNSRINPAELYKATEIFR